MKRFMNNFFEITHKPTYPPSSFILLNCSGLKVYLQIHNIWYNIQNDNDQSFYSYF